MGRQRSQRRRERAGDAHQTSKVGNRHGSNQSSNAGANLSSTAAGSPAEPARWLRISILLFGVLLPQVVLFGPALVGRTLLLPLDILQDRTSYLPRASATQPAPIPKEGTLGDLVFQ